MLSLCLALSKAWEDCSGYGEFTQYPCRFLSENNRNVLWLRTIKMSGWIGHFY
jgi:hypothetical protein